MKPVLLDLFCGAGGCTKGYQEAGFYVVGVDHKPQPNYCGDEFIEGDALEQARRLLAGATLDVRPGLSIALKDVTAVHASPPCQRFTKYHSTGRVRSDHPELIAPTRALLAASFMPYVIENVQGAPLHSPLILCGSMFDPPLDVQRHRLFESNWPCPPPMSCRHQVWPPNRFEGGRSLLNTGTSKGLCRKTVEIGRWGIPVEVQQRAMGIDWMTVPELSQAIPPAYTRHIGERLIAHLAESSMAAFNEGQKAVSADAA